MKKSILNYAVFILVVFGLLGCEKEKATFSYSFSSLNKLTIKNDISVRLIQDSANYIEISGQASIAEHIVPKIQGDTIVLSNPRALGAKNVDLWATVHFTDMKLLFLRNGGEVINDDTLRFSSFSLASNKAMGNVSLNLLSESLNIGLSTGALSVGVSGKAKQVSVWTTAPGFIDLLEFEAESVRCINNSSNNCYVWAAQSLIAEAQYLGKIYYRGSPSFLDIPEDQEDQILPLTD